MYNSVERADNHIDYFATTGMFDDVFQGPLYGYFYNRIQCEQRKHLKFTLYFVDPFDPVIDKGSNYFTDKEVAGFDNIDEHKPLQETKEMQVVPLQYNDFYSSIGRTEPTIDEALTNNIYHDRRTFFKRLLNKNPHQIKQYQENSILYKVSFDLPFEAIADHVTVDKTLRQDDVEKTKRIYYREEGYNSVENLFKKMKRMKSNMDEMEAIIEGIKNHPETYKRPVETGAPIAGVNPLWTKQCANFDNMCRTTDGYNIENAQYLLGKLKEAYEKMEAVLFQARYFDIRAEPVDNAPKKCDHNACTRMAVKGSSFCNQCIQLNAHECNFCGK